MSRSMGPIRAVIAFELRRRLREPATVIGLLVLFGILLVGHVEYWQALPPRPEEDRMFGYAFVGAMLAVLRFGLAEDRQLAFDEFLAGNLISPRRYLAAKLLTGIIVLLGVAATAFVLALALSGFEFTYAAWYTLLLTLAIWAFLPAVLVAEAVADTRFVAIVVFIIFFISIMVTESFYGAQNLIIWLGYDVERYAFKSLGGLALRALLATGLLLALAPLMQRRIRGGLRVPRM